MRTQPDTVETVYGIWRGPSHPHPLWKKTSFPLFWNRPIPVCEEVPSRKKTCDTFHTCFNAITQSSSSRTLLGQVCRVVGGGLCFLCSWSGPTFRGGEITHELRLHPGPQASLDYTITAAYTLYSVFCRAIGLQLLRTNTSSPLWMRMVVDVYHSGGILPLVQQVFRIPNTIL